MKGLASIVILLIIAVLGSGVDQRKNWRGIVPLSSTRADVERLLGEPPPRSPDGTWLYTPGPSRSIYFFDDQNVQIFYITEDHADQVGCSKIPVDTVTSISVSLKNHPPLSDLAIDEAKCETFDPTTPPGLGFKSYVDAADGMYVCTLQGKVNEYGYYGAASDRLICPSLFPESKEFCNMLVDFYQVKKPKEEE